MQKAYGDRLSVGWRYFSLEQVNAKDPEFKVWEAPPEYKSRGLLAFRAAEAARRQGERAFQRLHDELLETRFVRKQRLHERETIIDAAQRAGLDLERFQRDLEDPTNLRRLAEDHTEAVERYRIFGTPTLVFANGQAAYLKLEDVPASTEEAARDFELLHELIAERPYIWEVKRPEAFTGT
ncbi:MAG: DsbA family protein [Chloroflexi bacterium]|nr:DsbA family protein [Chloroflexota bacterium]